MFRLLSALGLAVLVAGAPVQAQTPSPVTPGRPAMTPPVVAPPARPATPKPAAAPAAAQPAVAPPAVAASSAKRVDLNTASEAELDSLPGIGPVRAKAIVAGRPYDSVDAVSAKKAVPAGVLAKVRGRIALANINTSPARDLQRTLPGIGDTRAGQIVAGRPYAAPEDLVTKGVLTQALYDKIKDLITY